MKTAAMPPEPGPPERLLVVAAHPGDADAAIAGSVARWVAEGAVAELVCCTSGDGRSDDAAADPLELASLREHEQRAAAEIIGYGAVTFLHQPEGALANDLALREQLVRVVRTFRPDTVATHDPRVLVSEDGYVNHVDHREAGAAALDAVEPAAANALAFPQLLRSEGLQPHVVSRLLFFWSDRPTHKLDVGAAAETRQRALAAHASQMGRAAYSGAGTSEPIAVIDLRR